MGEQYFTAFSEIEKGVDELPDNLTTHILRHTFASHLVMQGVDLSTVAALMGHSTIQITEHYAHLQPDHTRMAADRLPFYNSLGIILGYLVSIYFVLYHLFLTKINQSNCHKALIQRAQTQYSGCGAVR